MHSLHVFVLVSTVVAVCLRFYSLSHDIRHPPLALPRIRALDLHSNQLSGTIPGSVGNLKLLTCVSLLDHVGGGGGGGD